MKIKNNDFCENKTNDFCDYGLLERPRYFPRQLMTPDDLTLEQTFFLDKMRRHNRLLHGWGVVCGAKVKQKKDKDGNYIPWTVEISSGSVLDQVGNEIVISKTITYCLRKESVSGHHKNGDDPWCSDVPVNRPTDEPIYLAICYDECGTRPVRVSPAGCGCDDADCENSRIRESFRITALSDLPESYDGLDFTPGLREFDPCDCYNNCPECPKDPCVVLADITADDEGILFVDCFTHRRIVVSFSCYPVFCSPDKKERERREVEATIEGLHTHIDEEGMRILLEDHGGAIGAATTLPLTAIRGLGSTSDVGRVLNDVTLGDVAGLTFEEFKVKIDEWLVAVDDEKKKRFSGQSRLIWMRARQVEQLTSDYRMA